MLGLFNIPFEIQVSQADETMEPGGDPAEQVMEVSQRKALATWTACADPEAVVIAADTIVVCDGVILGKPKSREDACRMLTMLSGRSHCVMTGLTVMRSGCVQSCTEITEVFFRQISQKEILRYVESGDPMDKAGSYGIQNGAALFVEKIHGDYYNVMGLPVCRLALMLKNAAPELMEDEQ